MAIRVEVTSGIVHDAIREYAAQSCPSTLLKKIASAIEWASADLNERGHRADATYLALVAGLIYENASACNKGEREMYEGVL